MIFFCKLLVFICIPFSTIFQVLLLDNHALSTSLVYDSDVPIFRRISSPGCFFMYALDSLDIFRDSPFFSAYE